MRYNQIILQSSIKNQKFMNYLAHLLLAAPEPEFLIGAIMGDFLRGSVDHVQPPLRRLGIIHHRRIDRFTDDHPRIKTSKNRFSSPERRYAGIFIDVFFDHFLARHWHCYSEQPLNSFILNSYQILQQNDSTFPIKMQSSITYMINTNLLSSYQHKTGVTAALQRMSLRLRKSNPLSRADQLLNRYYRELDEDFQQFFPDLQHFALQQKNHLLKEFP